MSVACSMLRVRPEGPGDLLPGGEGEEVLLLSRGCFITEIVEVGVGILLEAGR